MRQFQFTNNWFDLMARPVWEKFVPAVKPRTILEVGSYEGAATCFLIETLAAHGGAEIHCVDNWGGGIEHQSGIMQTDMQAVHERFRHNIALAARDNVTLVVHHGASDRELSGLLAEGKANYFDFVYIDGSHQAPDVLCDAVLGFRLLKAGGIMAFDDYLWSETQTPQMDPLRCPKPAVDAFINLYCRKLRIVDNIPLRQLYVRKLSD